MLPTPMMTAMDRTVTIRHKKAMQITAPKGAMTRKTAMTTMAMKRPRARRAWLP